MTSAPFERPHASAALNSAAAAADVSASKKPESGLSLAVKGVVVFIGSGRDASETRPNQSRG